MKITVSYKDQRVLTPSHKRDSTSLNVFRIDTNLFAVILFYILKLIRPKIMLRQQNIISKKLQKPS